MLARTLRFRGLLTLLLSGIMWPLAKVLLLRVLLVYLIILFLLHCVYAST